MKDALLLPKNRYVWSLLALQGGYVNTAGILSIHIFVSHVTGFSSLFGMELIEGRFLKALYFLLVPIFFLLGAGFCSIFTELRRKRHQAPIYIHMLLFLSLIFLATCLLGEAHAFGDFGAPIQSLGDYGLLAVLSFSCGIQNALFTHYSGSIIRTTHLTGITTDLGIGLAKVFIGGERGEEKLNKIRIGIILSFILGSTLSAFLMPRFQFMGFLFPALTSIYIGLRLYYTRVSNKYEQKAHA